MGMKFSERYTRIPNELLHFDELVLQAEDDKNNRPWMPLIRCAEENSYPKPQFQHSILRGRGPATMIPPIASSTHYAASDTRNSRLAKTEHAYGPMNHSNLCKHERDTRRIRATLN